MEYEAVCRTDRGIRKAINQDSACVMIANTEQDSICMALLCDGMGGISLGECASCTVIERFVDWFENKLPYRLREDVALETIGAEWQVLLAELDAQLRNYGSVRQIKIGTTFTGMLFRKQRYLLVQSGDSRAYCLHKRIVQLSEDQSFVQKQIASGLMTEQEAKSHPKRNVLTDCIGGSRPSLPVCSYGRLHPGARYLLCSDGFVHELDKEEIWMCLGHDQGISDRLGDNMEQLIHRAMERGETDNITAVVVSADRASGLAGRFRSRTLGRIFEVKKKLIVTEGSNLTLEALPTTETEE